MARCRVSASGSVDPAPRPACDGRESVQRLPGAILGRSARAGGGVAGGRGVRSVTGSLRAAVPPRSGSGGLGGGSGVRARATGAADIGRGVA